MTWTANSYWLSSVESVCRTRKLQEKRNRYGKPYPLQSHFKQKNTRKKFPKYMIKDKPKLVQIQSMQITKHRFLANTNYILLAKERPSLASWSISATGGWTLATLAIALFSSGVPLSRNAPTTFPSLIQYDPNLGFADVGLLSPNSTVSPTLSP